MGDKQTTTDCNGEAVSGEAVIRNAQGMHARPVMRFVDLASKFASQIQVEKVRQPSDRVDGKSPMQMMLLCAPAGTAIRITATGQDAAQAVEALVGLVNRHFDQEVHG